jgi:hypothetical protein
MNKQLQTYLKKWLGQNMENWGYQEPHLIVLLRFENDIRRVKRDILQYFNIHAHFTTSELTFQHLNTMYIKGETQWIHYVDNLTGIIHGIEQQSNALKTLLTLMASR